ncbi:hypothetical protein Mgra_00007355 [Meloidogyne graminicola]|uniref:Uncharacterized protein n=1 Tax=Meloidogyne graminicola TaxID=189291 RepID=A0A8S9ZIT8_9BILA|nr:hypothetical protein Mgra_00007355 [Meloidogyne graminicola]
MKYYLILIIILINVLFNKGGEILQGDQSTTPLLTNLEQLTQSLTPFPEQVKTVMPIPPLNITNEELTTTMATTTEETSNTTGAMPTTITDQQQTFFEITTTPTTTTTTTTNTLPPPSPAPLPPVVGGASTSTITLNIITITLFIGLLPLYLIN